MSPKMPAIHPGWDVGRLVSVPMIGLGKIVKVLPKKKITYQAREERPYLVLMLSTGNEILLKRKEFFKY